MTVIPLTDPIWGLFWKISSFLINGGRHELPIHLSPGCPAASTRTRPKTGSGGRIIAIPLQTPAKTNLIRRALLAGAAAALLATASWYGWDYWTVGRFLVSTDDAYVKADNTTIAPKVSGYLNQVLVGDNQHVKAGQVLARIDDRDFKVALDQARADVAAAQAAVESKHAQLDVQQAVIASASATLDVDHRSTGFHRAGEQALHRSRPRPATAACRMRRTRMRAIPVRWPPSCATRQISRRRKSRSNC